MSKDMSHSFHLLGEECDADSKFWFPELHDLRALSPLPVHYALGLGGECGELLNLIKKANRKGDILGHLDREAASKEIADIFIYLVDLAHSLGINVWDAFEEKHSELEGRWGKRPVGAD